MSYTREQRRQLARDNLRQPVALARVPQDSRPQTKSKLMDVWRSREYLVQIIDEPQGIMRLTICRTSLDGDDWRQDIPWEDLQRLKRECGLGNVDAVEIFPADIDVVNVANMRHLWVLPEPLKFAWRRKPVSGLAK